MAAEEDLALEAGAVISLQLHQEERDRPGWWRATLGGHQEVTVRIKTTNKKKC